jgi:hypothetical protein
METYLDNINKIINTYTAAQYAAVQLKLEKKNYSLHVFNYKTGEIKVEKPSYDEYMITYWGSPKSNTLEKCIEGSRMSALNDYAEKIKMYTGWVKNGKVFVLNRKDRYVSFLYEIKDTGTLGRIPIYVSLKTNYNPKDVDSISDHMPHSTFKEKIDDGEYEISQDEKYLIKECDKLILKTV